MEVLLSEFLDSLSTEQIKQLAESKDMYCGEWVEFDADDESTWPEINEYVLVRYKNGHVEVTYLENNYTIGVITWAGLALIPEKAAAVTHYTTLPTFKEKRNENTCNDRY